MSENFCFNGWTLPLKRRINRIPFYQRNLSLMKKLRFHNAICFHARYSVILVARVSPFLQQIIFYSEVHNMQKIALCIRVTAPQSISWINIRQRWSLCPDEGARSSETSRRRRTLQPLLNVKPNQYWFIIYVLCIRCLNPADGDEVEPRIHRERQGEDEEHYRTGINDREDKNMLNTFDT